MPTKNRRLWVRKKAQIGFREKKNLQDPKEIEFLLKYDRYSPPSPYSLVSFLFVWHANSFIVDLDKHI